MWVRARVRSGPNRDPASAAIFQPDQALEFAPMVALTSGLCSWLSVGVVSS